MRHIPFARPLSVGNEAERFAQVLAARRTGEATFVRRCEELLRSILQCEALLVSSATHALEMAATLLGIGPGDRVIVPAFTMSSTANAFLLRGAAIVFADVDATGNLDTADVARLAPHRARAVVPVHYGGSACDLNDLRSICGNAVIIEDAAQAIGASFLGRPLGTFGACGVISFHETKNIGCGEGGALVLRDESLLDRAEVLRDKGTDRRRLVCGAADRYSWVDVGSSYTLAELNAAWLSGQLEQLSRIQARRRAIWNRYVALLEGPVTRAGASILRGRAGCETNAHLFALVFRSALQRASYIAHMRERGISCAFHYVALHTSPMGRRLHDGRTLPGAERLSSCLVRLPLFFDMLDAEVDCVADATVEFLGSL